MFSGSCLTCLPWKPVCQDHFLSICVTLVSVPLKEICTLSVGDSVGDHPSSERLGWTQWLKLLHLQQRISIWQFVGYQLATYLPQGHRAKDGHCFFKVVSHAV